MNTPHKVVIIINQNKGWFDYELDKQSQKICPYFAGLACSSLKKAKDSATKMAMERGFTASFVEV